MEINKKELDDIRTLLNRSRFNPNDLNKLKRVYKKIVDPEQKLSIVDWSCPSCVRRAIGLINNKLKNITIIND